MIHNQDRSGWFGASDTAHIMGPWTSPSFGQWWLEKLGLRRGGIQTLAMKTGTAFEHRILTYLNVPVWDRQIRMRRLRLRVNLDGEDAETISEVKTYGKSFRVTRPYWSQCQVEMFAARKPCRIVAYRLEPEDYRNWFRAIDGDRISFYPMEFDQQWIEMKYLPRLRYLAWCLKRGAWPDESDL